MMHRAILLTTLILILFSTAAMGASIDHRFGLTGKVGALIPLHDDFIQGTSDSHTGMAYGGGFIFGFCKNFAVELDVLRAPQLDVEVSGSKSHEASMTDVGVGFQYRFAPEKRLVPFVGIGADFIRGNLEQAVTNATYELAWTEGGHVNGGVDWFISNGIALSAEARFVAAFKGDINRRGTFVGEYDPMHFTATFGLRLILPESAFW